MSSSRNSPCSSSSYPSCMQYPPFLEAGSRMPKGSNNFFSTVLPKPPFVPISFSPMLETATTTATGSTSRSFTETSCFIPTPSRCSNNILPVLTPKDGAPNTSSASIHDHLLDDAFKAPSSLVAVGRGYDCAGKIMRTAVFHGASPRDEHDHKESYGGVLPVDAEERGANHSEKGVAIPGHFEGVGRVLSSNWLISCSLFFIPLGITSFHQKWPEEWIFFWNFMAIIPMAWMIGKSTEDLAAHTGQVIGGLLNATFGNIVEMLLCIAGMRQGELLVVKSTLIGSILSNLLLVLGCAFFFGGLNHKVQEFSAVGASTSASLMTLSCLCVGLPTVYATILSSAQISELQISRAVSIILALTYIQYLIFQLGTHAFLFTEEEEEDCDLTITAASVMLICATIITTFCSEYLVSAIEGAVKSWNISKGFIGIILLPIIGNAAEHYTAVVVAMRNKMDLSLGCAVGSSCQMALFVTPFCVLAAWIMQIPMTLDFHPFEASQVAYCCIALASAYKYHKAARSVRFDPSIFHILQDGYSNWLEGYMLITAYVCIALIYFFEESVYGDVL